MERTQKPKSFKPGRVGRPERLNQFLDVNILQWYHPIVRDRQDKSAAGLATRVAYAPFGETYASSGAPWLSFTGMDEDTEPNNPATLYDFPAREYGIQGRWPSPDPAGLAAVDPGNPQSWNRYAYVGNNPLAATDPTGLWALPVLVNPADGGGCIFCDIGLAVFDLLSILSDLGAPPPPQAAPAPPGGYGAGIDPYGTWTEQVPAGVQVFPSSITGIPNGSGCTYGSGSCGGGVYGFISCANGGCPTWSSYAQSPKLLSLLQIAIQISNGVLDHLPLNRVR